MNELKRDSGCRRLLPALVALAALVVGCSDRDEPAERAKPLPTDEEVAMLPSDGGKHFNRLIHEKSPYLLQHARNPVDWYPWSKEAFARAKKLDRPVFLSVGYSTCHWCHVMERESFERQDVAAILNEHFVAIKVDREERPDVDRIYMNATQLLTGRGGWPNSVWLTPDGKPWFAGTYFPREDVAGRPGFKTVLKRLSEVWRTRRKDVEQQAERFSAAIRRLGEGRHVEGPGKLGADIVAAAIGELGRSFDSRHGGFGGAPKFPPHTALRLLLQARRRGGDEPLLNMATLTLDAMALGGVRDHVGGGFHRYSTDARWFQPHFEKMLYDNAQLSRAYVDAYLITGNEEYRRVAVGIYEWVLREMTDPAGGFHSALDADSEGEEGTFYLWRYDEIIRALGPEEGELFCRVYSVLKDGNYRDEATGRSTAQNILHLGRPLAATAKVEGIDEARLRPRLDRALGKLLELRGRRVRPHLDDKVLTGWNGLMVGSLAHAGRVLKQPRYTAAAERAASFILAKLRKDGRLLRSWRKGRAGLNAYLDDHAFLADGLLDLHHATGRKRWLDEARTLVKALDDRYADPAGGYFFTYADHEELLARLKDPFDGAIPSGNAAAARVLVRLARLTGEEAYLDRAGKLLESFAGFMRQAPRGTYGLIGAAEMYLEQRAAAGPRETAGRKPIARSAKKPVTVEAFADRTDLEPGGQLALTVQLTIEKGWHVNSARPGLDSLAPMRISLKSDAAALGPISYPEGRVVKVGPDRLSVYDGTVRIDVPVKIAADAPAGRMRVTLEVRVQPCDDSRCLLPQVHTLPIPVEVTVPATSTARPGAAAG